MRAPRIWWGVLAGAAALPLLASPASGAVAHTVEPGETLWSIAAASNLTTRTVAAFNGLSEDVNVVVGETIQIPSEAEGAAALRAAGVGSGDASPASAVAHTVVPGETLWSIAAANNFTTRTIAAFNGLPEDANVVAGETIEIPSEADGAAALRAAGIMPAESGSGSSPELESEETSSQSSEPPRGCPGVSAGFDPTMIASAPGMGHVPSPWGELHLVPAAADAWNAMRQEALQTYGTDIYPNGPLSAYRTREQQAYLHCLFRSGEGEPANPPGTSSHERGVAVDLARPEMRQIVDTIGWKHGWGKVHGPGEWWHVDYLGR